MSEKPHRYLVLWGESPEYQYEDVFSDKGSAIEKVTELKKYKIENNSDHWCELYQYVGGF